MLIDHSLLRLCENLPAMLRITNSRSGGQQQRAILFGTGDNNRNSHRQSFLAGMAVAFILMGTVQTLRSVSTSDYYDYANMEQWLSSIAMTTTTTTNNNNNKPKRSRQDDPCHSSNFVNVTTPLFVRWEDYLSETQDAHQGLPYDFYVIQLGGNVGLNVGGGDPVWEYVRPCHWSAAILEPQPHIFAQLQHNYADVADRIQTLNLAVSNQRGNMSMRGGGETASLQTNQEGNIAVVTLADLWQRLQPLTRVDVLVVDVEGHENRVLQLQDLPSPQPRFVLLEIAHLSTEQRDGIDRALVRQGYVAVEDLKHMDRVARLKNAPPQDRIYVKRELQRPLPPRLLR